MTTEDVLDGRRIEYEAQLQQFTMDLRSAPERIVTAHGPNQVPNVRGYCRPPRLATAYLPCPEQSKTLAVPADHGFGLDDDENIDPAGPGTAEEGPEQAVQGCSISVAAVYFMSR